MAKSNKVITKEKWIAALRSGKYEQGINSLKTEDGGYCCLGVACVVAGVDLDSGTVTYRKDVGFSKSSLTTAHLEDYEETYKVFEALELTRDKEEILSGMNDCGKSFYQIADWIEENL